MSTRLKIQIAVGLLLIVMVTIAHGKLKESMNRAPTVAENVRVIEGDKLELDGARIRLFGIDAPELAQVCGTKKQPYACGKGSKLALEKLFLNAANIDCQKKAEDDEGWTLAVCRVNGLDINAEMVKNGQALADRYDSFYYVDDEKDARTNKRGLWASKFDKPWEWRDAQQASR